MNCSGFALTGFCSLCSRDFVRFAHGIGASPWDLPSAGLARFARGIGALAFGRDFDLSLGACRLVNSGLGDDQSQHIVISHLVKTLIDSRFLLDYHLCINGKGGWWACGLVAWWLGGLVAWLPGGLVAWWLGGLVA